MPLPSDERVNQLANDLIAQFDTMFGLHPGFRPVHAKGVLVEGRFSPSSEAATLTRAPHIARESTPVTARFSNFTGLPLPPDNDPNANPHGLAIRFQLGEHVRTDIIGHSTDGFPTRMGQEFLEFLQASAASGPSTPSPLLWKNSSALIRRRWHLCKRRNPARRVLQKKRTSLLRRYQSRWGGSLRALSGHTFRRDRTSGRGCGQGQRRQLPV